VKQCRFTDNVDTLYLDDALWGGGAKAASEMLSYARFENGAAVFDFGDGDVIRIEGLRRLEQLADDLDWF
jgi:serralysin